MLKTRKATLEEFAPRRYDYGFKVAEANKLFVVYQEGDKVIINSFANNGRAGLFNKECFDSKGEVMRYRKLAKLIEEQGIKNIETVV